MQLIIHAGYPKSGTSAIQARLHEGRAALAEHGIVYPAAGIYRNERAHHLFGWSLTGQTIPGGGSAPSPSEILAATVKEAKQIGAHRIIISSESIAPVLRDNPAKLVSLLQHDQLRSVTLELVVRRADEYLESFFFHSLNSWARNRYKGRIPNLIEAKRRILANPVGHLRIAQNAVSTRFQTHLRPYDRRRDMVNDFLQDILSASASRTLNHRHALKTHERNNRLNSRFLSLVYILSQSEKPAFCQKQLLQHGAQLRAAFNDGASCVLLNSKQRNSVMQAAIDIYKTLPNLSELAKGYPLENTSTTPMFESQWTFNQAQISMIRELFNLDLDKLKGECLNAIQ